MDISKTSKYCKISKVKLIFITSYLLILMNLILRCFKIDSINLLISGIVVSLPLLLKLEYIYIYIYMCLPFFNILNKNMGSTSLFYIILIILLFKYLFTKSRKYRFKFKMLLVLSIFIITGYNLNFGTNYISWLMIIIPLIFIYKEEYFISNLKYIILLYSLSMILSSIFGYYMLNNDLSIYTDSYVWNAGEISLRFSGLVGDSNVYSQSVLIIIASLLILFENINRKYIIFLIIIMSLFSILTYSKMNLIMLVGLYFVFIFYKIKTYLKNKDNLGKLLLFTLFSFIIITIISSFIIKNIDNSLVSSYIVRFNAKDLFTGRFDVYKYFINLWSENFLKTLFVGIGFMKYSAPYSIDGSTLLKYSHNIYIETISLFGVFVFLGIFIFLLNKIIKNIKVKKIGLILLLPTLVLLITGLVLHGNLEVSYYFNVLLSISLLECKNIKDKKF